MVFVQITAYFLSWRKTSMVASSSTLESPSALRNHYISVHETIPEERRSGRLNNVLQADMIRWYEALGANIPHNWTPRKAKVRGRSPEPQPRPSLISLLDPNPVAPIYGPNAGQQAENTPADIAAEVDVEQEDEFSVDGLGDSDLQDMVDAQLAAEILQPRAPSELTEVPEVPEFPMQVTREDFVGDSADEWNNGDEEIRAPGQLAEDEPQRTHLPSGRGGHGDARGLSRPVLSSKYTCAKTGHVASQCPVTIQQRQADKGEDAKKIAALQRELLEGVKKENASFKEALGKVLLHLAHLDTFMVGRYGGKEGEKAPEEGEMEVVEVVEEEEEEGEKGVVEEVVVEEDAEEDAEMVAEEE
ncbi:hypothetical protein FLONG3_7402 [Fusarium longipes]|uniref:Uncharacterized protein n=1 Tax=Fusarium longipes TaxID=694270 RepID=A0A395SDS9_9HYPO|nr:hypothetical protein FLONG3_7402 [Fusarium longipes]